MSTVSNTHENAPVAPTPAQPGKIIIDANDTPTTAQIFELLSRRTTGDKTLFQQVVSAHGLDLKDSFVVGMQNFVLGPDKAGGIPHAPLDNPTADIYLGFSGAAAAAPGDTVICNRCQPGFLDLLREVGLLDPSTTIVEVDPKIRGRREIGWPNSDPLSRLCDETDQRPSVVEARELLKKLTETKGKPYFVGTFLSQYMREQAESLGLTCVQATHPTEVNKATFRYAASQHGFTVSPGLVVESEQDLNKITALAIRSVISRIANGDSLGLKGWNTVWIKLQDGSGGDFVRPVNISRQNIEAIKDLVEYGILNTLSDQAICENLIQHCDAQRFVCEIRSKVFSALGGVRNAIAGACLVNDYGDDMLNRLWSGNKIFPNDLKIIAEMDANFAGKILGNCSNVVTIDADGGITVEGNFMQITGPEGDYRGSRPISLETEFGDKVANLVSDEVRLAANWMAQLGFRGRLGVDFFIVEKPDGQKVVILTEINGRIPISGVSKVIADKLGAPEWININIEAPETVNGLSGDLNTADDFKRIFGEYANFTPGDFSKARIIPQAFRALYDEQGLVFSSRKVKALIVGPTHEACMELVKELLDKGFTL